MTKTVTPSEKDLRKPYKKGGRWFQRRVDGNSIVTSTGGVRGTQVWFGRETKVKITIDTDGFEDLDATVYKKIK